PGALPFFSTMSVNIVGVPAYYHDSAACLLQDGQVVAAAQEERFTRKKNDNAFPSQSLQFVLRAGGISIAEVDYAVFYDKPLLKFERLLSTYVGYAPRGITSFLKAMPLWLKETPAGYRLMAEELADAMVHVAAKQ